MEPALDLIRRDIPACDADHQGGVLAGRVLNGIESRLDPERRLDAVPRKAGQHDPLGGDRHGARDYASSPSFRSGAHEQHHE